MNDSTLTFTSPDFGQLPGDFGFVSESPEASRRTIFDDASADERDNAAFSLGYGAELDGVGLEASVIGAYPTANAQPENQAYGIGGGLAVSYSGFTLAGGAAWDDADGDGGEDWRTDLGIAYGEGPWRVSLSGIYTADSASGEAMLGSAADVRYNLAAGVSFFAIGYMGREEAGADGGSDVVTVSSGIRLSF